LADKIVTVKTAEARQRDVGRGKVRIDGAAMRSIDVTTGDVIEIQGKKTTAAVAWPAYPEDQGSGIIRTDGLIRENCGVTLAENVKIKKADVKAARSLTLAPTSMPLSIDYGFENFVKRKLLGYPVCRGDIVHVPILGKDMPFTVISSSPEGICLVTDATSLNVSEKPLPLRIELIEDYYRSLGFIVDKTPSDVNKLFKVGFIARKSKEICFISFKEKVSQQEMDFIFRKGIKLSQNEEYEPFQVKNVDIIADSFPPIIDFTYYCMVTKTERIKLRGIHTSYCYEEIARLSRYAKQLVSIFEIFKSLLKRTRAIPLPNSSTEAMSDSKS
jgi:hypothetical protein